MCGGAHCLMDVSWNVRQKLKSYCAARPLTSHCTAIVAATASASAAGRGTVAVGARERSRGRRNRIVMTSCYLCTSIDVPQVRVFVPSAQIVELKYLTVNFWFGRCLFIYKSFEQ